jgi:uncharacterized Zn finger protein
MPKMVLDDFECHNCGTVEQDVFRVVSEDEVFIVCPNCGEFMVRVISKAHLQEHGAKGLQRFMMGIPGHPDKD